MKSHRDDRAPLVLAMEWSVQITTIALEMVLPGVGGLWLDQWLGTQVVFLIIGVLVGFAVGMWHLIKLTRLHRTEDTSSSPRENDGEAD